MLAPIEYHNGIYLKRNDLNSFNGCYGGKAECANDYIQKSYTKTFVTCGSRDSLQCDIVSELCENLGYECHIFVPAGADTITTTRISNRKFTTLHRVENGRMVVVKHRAKVFAQSNYFTLIPFGMESMRAIKIIAQQVKNIPESVNRIVVPVGGGITLCGVLLGIEEYLDRPIDVLGVVTGKNPNKLLGYFSRVCHTPYNLVNYKDNLTPDKLYSLRTNNSIDNIKLDPVYEGKCYPFLQDGDLLWIVGYHEV